jgi:hypothetical protein
VAAAASQRIATNRVIRVAMTSESSGAFHITWARLVPELLVTDIDKSLRFWRDVCGFTVLFDRPNEGFAYLDLDGAQIMLDENWPNPRLGDGGARTAARPWCELPGQRACD